MAALQSPATASPRPVIVRSTVRPTLEGLGWLGVSVLLLYQGWLRSINLVALLAAFLIALFLINLFWVWRRFRLKRLEVRRRINEPVFAREQFTVTLEATNPTQESQPSVRIMDAGPYHHHGWVLPTLRGGETRGDSAQVTLPRRGLYLWPPISISTGHPFGLARRTVLKDLRESVLVLPRLGRLHRGRLRGMLLEQTQINQSTKRPVMRHPGAQTEFYGLREFRTGDSPRWIHWRTSARMGELMVREFEEPPVDNLVVVVDAWLPRPAEDLERDLAKVRRDNQNLIRYLLKSGPPPPPAVRRAKEAALAKKEEPFRQPLERLEFALSLAATICWEWCRQPGARVGLAIADRTSSVLVVETGMRQVFPLLENLARVQGCPDPQQEALLGELGLTQVPAGPALLITTRANSFDLGLSNRLRRPVLKLNVDDGLVEDVFQETKTSSRATLARGGGATANGAGSRRSSGVANT